MPDSTIYNKIGDLFTAREAWLAALADILTPVFTDYGTPLPSSIRIFCAWPLMQPQHSGVILGKYWAPGSFAGPRTRHEIFIACSISSAEQAATVLIHELIHASLGIDEGHGPEFCVQAKQWGLLTPVTHPLPGPALCERIAALVAPIGTYPTCTSNRRHQ